MRGIAFALVVLMMAAGCSGDEPTSTGPTGAEPTGSAIPADARVIEPTPIDCAQDRYPAVDPTTLPAELDRDDYRLSSARAPALAASRHHLCGQKGAAVDLAWGITSGSPEVVLAITDSGIRWRNAEAMGDLARRAWLNPGEIPLPRAPDLTPADEHDANEDGVVDISDYVDDPRLQDLNGNGVDDPEDLILAPQFSDGVDDDGNGYVDDISGWDFLHDDNNPLDDVDYGHGTGEALDAVAEANGAGDVGVCPQCRFLPLRVSDSFIASSGRFAAAVFFAIDSGANVVQSALGGIDNPSVAQVAIDAAVGAGLPVVASMADEQSEHPNLPTALAHTIPVNSVTEAGDGAVPLSESYLAVNGCTNTGGQLWVSVPSDGCSSEAVGRAAGMVGLILSAALDRDIPTHPRLARDDNSASGRPANRLSPAEVAQLLASTADDIDFGSPIPPSAGTSAEPAEDFDAGALSTRFPTGPGRDRTSGYGRVNAYEAVRAVEGGSIPPEAGIESPRFADLLGTTGTLEVTGRAAAVRAEHFEWILEWAPGADPPPMGEPERWTKAAEGGQRSSTVDGVLGEIDLTEVAAALPDGAAGPPATEGGPDPSRFAVRIRLTVTDAAGRVGVDQRQVFVHHDPDLVRTTHVPGAGASSPVAADVDGDGTPELVLGTDDGTLHVFRSDGEEVPGFPVTTARVAYWHPDSSAARRAEVEPPFAGMGVGRPVVSDLDQDGSVELAATDVEGNLHVWGADGRRRDGFALTAPSAGESDGRESSSASVDPDYSSDTDEHNRTKRQFLAQPAVGDLDGDGDLEVVAAAADRHVYAWHDDGAPVSGFPALVVDPSTVEAVDPTTHRVTFSDPAVGQGGEIVATPAVGDLDGDGRAEVVVGTQEQYEGELEVDPEFSIPGAGGNGRLYALTGAGAIDWVVPLAMLTTGILPSIGDGVAMSPRIADLDGDGTAEVIATSAAGPVYVLSGRNGRSEVGISRGEPSALPWTDVAGHAALFSAFGGVGLADLTGDGRLDVVAPVVNELRAFDQQLPEHQSGSATLLMAWDGATLEPLPGYPVRTADLAFFVEPAAARNGSADVAIAANGVFTLDAVGAGGAQPAGWPKLTAGWAVGSPAVGDLDGDGHQEVVVVLRDGRVHTWRAAFPSG